MEVIIVVIGIIVVFWILKKLFGSSDKVWEVAKKHGLKKTDSSSENCSRCIDGTHTITTIEGKGSINGVHCSKKDIEVTESMVCSEFVGLKLKSFQHSLFGN